MHRGNSSITRITASSLASGLFLLSLPSFPSIELLSHLHPQCVICCPLDHVPYRFIFLLSDFTLLSYTTLLSSTFTLPLCPSTHYLLYTQRMLTEKTRELSKRTKELEEIKGTNETYLASVERRYGEETALYRKRSGEREGILERDGQEFLLADVYSDSIMSY